MANTIECGQCIRYAAQKRPQQGGRKPREFGWGHCLDQTIYAVNKPGKAVYPPGAKTATLPFGRHSICQVKKDEIRPNCTAAKTVGT